MYSGLLKEDLLYVEKIISDIIKKTETLKFFVSFDLVTFGRNIDEILYTIIKSNEQTYRLLEALKLISSAILHGQNKKGFDLVDLKLQNLLWDKSNKVLYFIDLEHAGIHRKYWGLANIFVIHWMLISKKSTSLRILKNYLENKQLEEIQEVLMDLRTNGIIIALYYYNGALQDNNENRILVLTKIIDLFLDDSEVEFSKLLNSLESSFN